MFHDLHCIQIATDVKKAAGETHFFIFSLNSNFNFQIKITSHKMKRRKRIYNSHFAVLMTFISMKREEKKTFEYF